VPPAGKSIKMILFCDLGFIGAMLTFTTHGDI
jgi:hypothetical protein